jgi:hypothetical protein
LHVALLLTKITVPKAPLVTAANSQYFEARRSRSAKIGGKFSSIVTHMGHPLLACGYGESNPMGNAIGM